VGTNLIGTDVGGGGALGNWYGICIRNAGRQNTVRTNVIAGNQRGVLISREIGDAHPGNSSRDTRIRDNRIGTNLAGTATLPNGGRGVDTRSPNTVIENNLVSGNERSGVFVGFSGDDAEIVNNSIGTNQDGTKALANGKSGIFVEKASGTVIGGSAAGEGNLISGNAAHGLRIVGTQTKVTNTSVSGNKIGTNQAGNASLGNGKSGVFLDNAVRSTVTDNVIAFNGPNGDGVTVVSERGASRRNSISTNSIFRNGGLGIDLADDGPTANDPGDPDGGPNRRQNFPNLTEATIDQTGDLLITYRVPSTAANAAYSLRIEFFEADVSGREGKTFLAAGTYPAGMAGTARQVTLGAAGPLGVAAGDSIVATARDDRGSTSEFSSDVVVERHNDSLDNGTRLDFGDAPDNDTRYPTLSSNDGASHTIQAGFHLGEAIDANVNGQPTATASGDDTDGTDDEDGVTLDGPWTPGQHQITVNASASGRLNAWVDWNANGDWQDAGEQIATDANLSAGNNTLTVDVPSDAATSETFARFRFSSAGGLGPTGPASDGEVEDYNLTLVKSRGLEDAPARYDTDGNGAISISELGSAATDYARGGLTISELGDVAAAYAQS